jgi:hypothetical protein
MSSGRGHQPSKHDPNAEADLEATKQWNASCKPKPCPTGLNPTEYNPYAVADGKRSEEWARENKRQTNRQV